MTMNRLFSSLLLACLALPSGLQAATPQDPYTHFFAQSLGDLPEELEIAREQGKHGIFVFFEMDECPFCHRMKQTVLNQPAVQEYFGRTFHSLTIDVESDVEIVTFDGREVTQKEFARQNRVRATPLMVFYDLAGQPIFKYVGATAGAEEFLWMGEYIAQGVYREQDESGRTIRFARYKKMKKKNQAL